MPTPEDRHSDKPPGGGSPRRNRLNRTIVFSLLAMAAGFYLANHAGKWFRDDSPAQRDFAVMNTYARITVPEGAGGLTPNELAELAEREVRLVNDLMGPFGPQSDVRRLNETPAGAWTGVDPRTWTVTMEALRWHRLSGGAFDPTIGPVKSLFTFDRSEAETWPDDAALAEAKSRVGADKLRFRREGMRLSWERDGMKLDLGAIAKGYAADLAAEALLRHGVASALVDIGGELRALGRKPGNPPTPWRAGIRNPRGGDIIETIDLADAAVATSGDYERYFTYRGGRYMHIIDPRTGLPLAEGVASVTVVHPSSCLAADALATTLSVLGADGSEKFLREQALGLFNAGVRVVMLTVDGDGLLRTEMEVKPGGEVTRREERP